MSYNCHSSLDVPVRVQTETNHMTIRNKERSHNNVRNVGKPSMIIVSLCIMKASTVERNPMDVIM
jgi:hypothetical protein